MKAYVYEHWRPDINQPFWVGKGTTTRKYIFKRRTNDYYNNIVRKLKSLGLSVEIRMVAEELTDEDAFKIEEDRIQFWIAQGIRLANQAKGGRGGTSGIKRSAESIAKQIKASTGRKVSPDHHRKIIERLNSPEAKAANSAVHKGRKRLASTRMKMSAAQKRSWADPIIGKNRRDAAHKAMCGRVTPDEVKQKQRRAKTPEIRSLLADIARAKWAEPGERERRSAAMSVANTGRIVTDAARESASKAMTPERRANSSADLKRRWNDPIARQEMSAALSAARTGVSLSPSHVESMRKSWTPERRKAVSEKMKEIRKNRVDGKQ